VDLRASAPGPVDPARLPPRIRARFDENGR